MQAIEETPRTGTFCRSFVCLFVCLFVCWFLCLLACLLVCLFVLFVLLAFCLMNKLSVSFGLVRLVSALVW
jgi:fatty-acid desaturase